ncbi:MAG: HD domain-containing protein [Rubripirellula sp.]
MNRTPVADLTDGQPIDQVFRAADKQLRVNRQGGKYILMRLSDKSGVIAAMMWNVDETMFESFDRGGYVHCHGRTQIHNGALQLIVTEIKSIDESEVDVEDFERFDANESDRLMTRLGEILRGLRNAPLRKLAEVYLADEEFVARFKKAAAAVSNHHAFPGGLLRHTVDMMELCQLVGPRYPQLDADLLTFGAFLHDLGKIEELSCDGEISYTDRGQLVGHIVIGVQMLGEKIADFEKNGEAFPAELRLHLEHMVVSHHGQIEFGSPKLPVMLESVTLHNIDNLDAKLWSYTAAIQTDVSGDGNWTNYTPSIGRKLWKKQS